MFLATEKASAQGLRTYLTDDDHHRQVSNFMANKSSFVSKLFIFQSIGYICPIFHNIGKAMEGKLSPKWGVPGVFAYIKTPLETGLFGTKCRVPVVYTFWLLLS